MNKGQHQDKICTCALFKWKKNLICLFGSANLETLDLFCNQMKYFIAIDLEGKMENKTKNKL